MYSRSYYADETSRVTLPENYDGTAFRESDKERMPEQPIIESNDENSVEASGHIVGEGTGFGRIPILSALFGSGESCGLSGPMNLGIEEILILATAAFLFFSKDGDKESAIILLLLLLVN